MSSIGDRLTAVTHASQLKPIVGDLVREVERLQSSVDGLGREFAELRDLVTGLAASLDGDATEQDQGQTEPPDRPVAKKTTARKATG
jgi:hypothetical protein